MNQTMNGNWMEHLIFYTLCDSIFTLALSTKINCMVVDICEGNVYTKIKRRSITCSFLM